MIPFLNKNLMNLNSSFLNSISNLSEKVKGHVCEITLSISPAQ